MTETEVKKLKDNVIEWIQKWFYENGRGCNVIVGISGGKDSSVVAALMCEALGKHRVIGVLMPNGVQDDIHYAYKLVKHLGIKYMEINIKDTIYSITHYYDNVNTYEEFDIFNPESDGYEPVSVSEQTKINLPARIRMSVLYAVAQSMNGRVANTCNLSEDYVGYSTRWGDSVGDFSPLGGLTVTEVKELGKVLGLPDELINKTPSDGLSGKTDEENLGFTYEQLDKYINTGEADKETATKIERLHKKNLFKLKPMPIFMR